MKTLGSILILCFAFTFGNAQEITVNADSDPGADFTKYKTFSLVDRDETGMSMDHQTDQQHTDRAEGEQTGSGYGTQGATGTTRDHETMGQETKDGDQGMTGDQGREDREADVAEDDTFGDNETDQVGTTERDHETQGTTEQGTTMGDQQTETGTTGTTGDQQTQTGTYGTTEDKQTQQGDQGTYGTTGDQHMSHAKAHKKSIKEAIKSELESKGFTYSEDNPDLLVNFSVFKGESDFVMGQDQNTYSAWGPQVGQTDQVNIEAGTVVVHLVDAEKNQLVYQAFANAGDEEKMQDEQTIKEVVSRIFEEIPETNR